MDGKWQRSALEILDNIFSFCEEDDAARSARVCKNWMDVALDHAWHDLDVEGFIYLCKILAPLGVVPGQTESAESSVLCMACILHICYFSVYSPKGCSGVSASHHPQRLETFLAFCKESDAITSPVSDCCRILSRASLADLMLTKPNALPLLPQLRVLQVGGNMNNDAYPWRDFFIQFLHDRLRRLDIVLPTDAQNIASCFLDEVTWRAPNVEFFDVVTLAPSNEAVTDSDSITRFVLPMQKLTRVAFSSCLLVPSLILSLQNMPSLETIHVYSDRPNIIDMTPFGRLPQSIIADAFPRLAQLRLQCSLEEWNRLLATAVCMSPNLCHLKIDVVSADHPKTFQRCLKLIAETFPLLQSLKFTRNGDLSVIIGNGPDASLGYEDLVPLTSLKKLVRFKLRFVVPVSIKNNELAVLLSKMPSLEVLELNPDPIRLTPTPLDMNVLPMLALACPNLQSLLLHLNATKPITTPDRFAFKQLSKIGFGTSPLQDSGKHDIMVFLSQIVPEDCKMDQKWCLAMELSESLDSEAMDSMDENRQEWADVAKLLPLLMDVRRETIKNGGRLRKDLY